MPIVIPDNSLYKVQNLKVEKDGKGYYLTMNPGKADACVICTSREKPVTHSQLKLSRKDLDSLFSSGRVENREAGYTLQGVSRQQLSASPQFRNFDMDPPCYVQVWGMVYRVNEEVMLYVPRDPEKESCVLVPIQYSVQNTPGAICVRMEVTSGYCDGDLLYQIGDHNPIPIPASALNKVIPMRPGVVARVFAAPEAGRKYVSCS